MVEWVKACAAKPNNLSSIPSTHMGGEVQFPEAGLDCQTQSVAYACLPPHTTPHTHTNKQMIVKEFSFKVVSKNVLSLF